MTDGSPLVHIVDDDRSVVIALRRLPQSWGMQVQMFASGEEFQAALSRSHDADCSLVDVQMPGMNGLEVQECMNRAGVDIPVIFITAHAEEGVEEQALRAGAVGFLRKPFTDEALIGLIRIALQRRRKPFVGAMRHGQSKEYRGESSNEDE